MYIFDELDCYIDILSTEAHFSCHEKWWKEYLYSIVGMYSVCILLHSDILVPYLRACSSAPNIWFIMNIIGKIKKGLGHVSKSFWAYLQM